MAHRMKTKPFFHPLLPPFLLIFLILITVGFSLTPVFALTREGSIPAQSVPNSGAPYVSESNKWTILVGRDAGNLKMAIIDIESKTVYRYLDRNVWSWGWIRDAKGVILNNDRILGWVVNVGSNTVIAVVDYRPISNPGTSSVISATVSGTPTNVYIPWAYVHNNHAYAWIVTDAGKLIVARLNTGNNALEIRQDRSLAVALSTASIRGWYDPAVQYHVVAIRRTNGDWLIVHYNSDYNVWYDLITVPGVNADPFYSVFLMFNDPNNNYQRIYLWGYVQPFLDESTRKFRVGVVKVVLDLYTLEATNYSHDYTVITGELPGGSTLAWAWPDYLSPNYFSFLIPGYNSVDMYIYVSRVLVRISNGYGAEPVSITVAGQSTAQEYGFNKLSYTSSVYINSTSGWVWEYNNGNWYAFTGAQKFEMPTVFSIKFLTQEITRPGQEVMIEVNATGGPLTVVTKYYVNNSLSYQWAYINTFASPWEAVILPYIRHNASHTPAVVEFSVEVYYSGILLASANKTYMVLPVDLVVLWLDYSVDNIVVVNFTLMLWDNSRNTPYWEFVPLTIEIYYYDLRNLMADYYEFSEWDYDPEKHTYFHQFALPPGYYFAKFKFADPFTGENKVFVSDMFKVYNENGVIPEENQPINMTTTTTVGNPGGFQGSDQGLGGWDTSYIGDALNFMVSLIIVLVLILGPALVLSKEAGLKTIGFIAGSIVGLIVATVTGLVPWYLSVFGFIVLILLIWGRK